MSLSRSLMLLLVALVAIAYAPAVSADNGQESFAHTGYPIIMTVGGSLLVLMAAFHGARASNVTPAVGPNSIFWGLAVLLIYVSGIFLIFGPSLYLQAPGSNTADAVTDGQGVRAAEIGIQLVLQSAIGAYCLFTRYSHAMGAFCILGIFNTAALLGDMQWFNFVRPIWTLNTLECNAYFYPTDPYGAANAAAQRCDNNGYLMFLRIWGTLTIIWEGIAVGAAFVAWTTNQMIIDQTINARAMQTNQTQLAKGVPMTTNTGAPIYQETTTKTYQPVAMDAANTQMASNQV